MPTKARHAASIAAGLGGSVRIRVLTEKGYSKRQLKQMAHGPHQILVASETKMKLTNLGRKVAAIGEAKPSSTQD